jgi:alanyl-tRNA synthetase
MLGNWSFGDYFKEEAIAWAWELLTDVWKLPKDQLYATVFGGDEVDGLERDTETAEMWKKMTDLDPSHLLFFGKKDNFWEMGETDPVAHVQKFISILALILINRLMPGKAG